MARASSYLPSPERWVAGAFLVLGICLWIKAIFFTPRGADVGWIVGYLHMIAGTASAGLAVAFVLSGVLRRALALRKERRNLKVRRTGLSARGGTRSRDGS